MLHLINMILNYYLGSLFNSTFPEMKRNVTRQKQTKIYACRNVNWIECCSTKHGGEMSRISVVNTSIPSVVYNYTSWPRQVGSACACTRDKPTWYENRFYLVLGVALKLRHIESKVTYKCYYCVQTWKNPRRVWETLKSGKLKGLFGKMCWRDVLGTSVLGNG